MPEGPSYSPGEIADRLAIQNVIARYVHALDAHELDALDEVFLPDAQFDLTSAGGLRARWPELKAYFAAEHQAKFAHDFHLFSNLLIEFDATRATAQTKSKVINPRALPASNGAGPSGEIAVGVYVDDWKHVEHGWRIAQRVWHRAFVLRCEV